MEKGSQTWNVVIRPPFPGLAPGYWRNALIAYGNKNHASAMTDCDLTDPARMTQGPGLADLTNGSQAAAVTTLIRHISPIPVSANLGFGIGGARLYRLSATTVTNGVADTITWPYLIDKPAVTGEDGESVVYYRNALYGFYNHSGGAGDILRYDLAGTIVVAWGSTTPIGAATLVNAPHPSWVGGDDVLYGGNGAAVLTYDGLTNTISTTELDLPPGTQVVSGCWNDNVNWIAANYPNLTGNNANIATIRLWRGLGAGSWEDQPFIQFKGTIGALIPKDGRVFVVYQDLSGVQNGGYKLGVVVGNAIQELAAYAGTLSNFAQVDIYQNMLQWVSDGRIHLYGAVDAKLPPIHSQHADGGHATVGALASPFGTPLVASTDGGANFRLAQFSGLSVASTWNSIVFEAQDSVIDEIRVFYGSAGAGARCDMTISYNQASATYAVARAGQTGTLTHANDGTRRIKSFYPGLSVEDFRIDLSWANGSATNAMHIYRIVVLGHTVPKS